MKLTEKLQLDKILAQTNGDKVLSAVLSVLHTEALIITLNEKSLELTDEHIRKAAQKQIAYIVEENNTNYPEFRKEYQVFREYLTFPLD